MILITLRISNIFSSDGIDGRQQQQSFQYYQFAKSIQLKFTQMQPISFVILLLAIFELPVGHCDEYCQMTAVKSFDDCTRDCQKTAKKYYNRGTRLCQKQVQCKQGTAFRVYQNLCIQTSNFSTVGKSQTAAFQQFQQIHIVVVHGNFLMQTKQKMCYPGFMSSRNRVKIDTNVYEEYYCDVLIGSIPEKYPRQFGQFFFWKCSVSQKLAFLKKHLDDNEESLYQAGALYRQPYYYLKQFTLLILLYAEIAFFLSVIGYHIELILKCCQNIKKRLGFDNENQE